MRERTGSDDLVRNRFLQAALADLEAGGLRTLKEYQNEHPGFADVVAEEYARLAAGDPGAVDVPLPLERIGPYRVLRELGRGGQGVVLLAEDERLGRRVAIKLLLGLAGLLPESVTRFRREAALAARLRHPGVCTIFEAGVEGGVPFVAMELVEGRTLAARIAEARAPGASPGAALAPRECIRIVAAVARALHVAHEAGVVHRDVKPANVMLRPDGEPVVLDFGLAHDLDSDGTSGAALTRSGDVFGTPAYMAPEQIEGAAGARADRRTDVWALGAMLYEALTLTPPFRAPTRAGLWRAVLEQEPPDLRRAARGVSRDLAVVVATALAKEPGQRYADAAALADDLDAVLASRPIAARPPSLGTRVARWARREPALATVLLLLIVAVASASGLGGYLLASAPAIATGEVELARLERERLIGEVIAGRRRGDEAAERLRAALELDPRYSVARVMLALQVLRDGHRGDALALLDAAPDDAENPEILALAAEHARAAGGKGTPPAPEPDAIRSAEEAYLAATLALEGRPDDAAYARALELARRAIYLNPRPPERYLHLLVRSANALDDMAELARGEQALLARFSDSALAWFYVGMARSHDDPAGAADANARSLELDPEFPQAWVILCAMRMLAGQFEQATLDFERGIEHTTPGSYENLRLLSTRAGFLASFGFHAEAADTWGRVLAIEPDNVDALVARGALLRELERDDEADEDLFHALELAPENAQAKELLGR